MDMSNVMNWILGGGLLSALLGLLSLKATLRKAEADAEKAKAEAESVRMDNAEHATRILMDNIVNPLKEELNETRKCLEASKREMARLRKSLDAANGCRHRDECPVIDQLREQKVGAGNGRDTGGTETAGQRKRDKNTDDGAGDP